MYREPDGGADEDLLERYITETKEVAGLRE